MKISNYPEVESLNEDDLLVISRPGEGTKSVSIAALAELLAAGVGNSVANNLNVTEEGYILDARQGKVLKDLHDERIKVLYDGAASGGQTLTLADSIANYFLIIFGTRWSSGQVVNSSVILSSRFMLGGGNSPQVDFWESSNGRQYVSLTYLTERTVRVNMSANTGYTGGCCIIGVK